MKKGRSVAFDLKLAEEMKSPRFAEVFQKELSRNRLAEQSRICAKGRVGLKPSWHEG